MNHEDIRLKNYDVIRIEPIFEDVVRIRYNESGLFRQSLTERYDFVETDFAPVDFMAADEGGLHRVCFGQLAVEADENGVLRFVRADGTAILARIAPISPRENAGVGARLSVGENERFYGGGYRPQQSIECSGQILKNDMMVVTNNGPMPWFMSSAGWGLFWNTTYENYFDVKYTKPDEMVLWSPEGELDIFLFTGDFRHMIDRFTQITGRPMLMPMFGYGISTVDGETDTEITLLDKAERFRREGIPCDIFSLGPEWMSTRYDMTTKQAFNLDRYYVADWMRGDQSFIGALLRYGIKTVLWTPCNYDLTYEAERQYHARHPEAEEPKRLYDRSVFKTDDRGHMIDNNSKLFHDDNIKEVMRADQLTKPDEAWVTHFNRFFDLGVAGIAEDGCTVYSFHEDRLYGNGRTDREMHNLNQSLNAQQYFRGFREHTGKRIMVRTPSTYIGHQRYCGTWCGDTTSGTSLVGLVKYSFQGQSNVSADMINWNLEQMHMGMLMPWTLHFCWCYMLWPWQLDDERRNAFHEYAVMRYSLMPYIYTAAWQAYKTGLSICRAMVIHYPDDPETWNMFNQYMFGEDLLVGAMTQRVYLPEGRWIDYWTGHEYEGKQYVESGYPKDKGGYLFIRKGAILPYWPPVNYVGEKVIDEMTLRIYPEQAGHYDLYEDDGISFDFEQGAYALTHISYERTAEGLRVSVGKPSGRYAGMPEKRTYHVEVYMDKPARDGAAWPYDGDRKAVCFDIEGSGSVIIG